MPGIDVDYLIIGGGIAGASIGYWLAPHGQTLILEQEPMPGYHSTGRSAAMVIDSYGPPQVRALTAASRVFFGSPPPGFSADALTRARGALIIGRSEDRPLLDEHWEVIQSTATVASRLDPLECKQLVPVLRTDDVAGAILEPAAADIDVNALHQGYLRGMARQGGKVICNSPVDRIERTNERWEIYVGDTRYRTPVIVNAAGAWCDEIARLAGVESIGVTPKRRSAFLFAPPTGQSIDAWPVCAAVDWSWYLKPEAGLLLGSPANADPVTPHDVQAEEIDIAIGIDAIETATTLQIRRPQRVWAGLRSFVADGELVGGWDLRARGFFWVAGQGGYGVQTSAAMGEMCASLIRDTGVPHHLQDFGLAESLLSPTRLVSTPDGGLKRFDAAPIKQ